MYGLATFVAPTRVTVTGRSGPSIIDLVYCFICDNQLLRWKRRYEVDQFEKIYYCLPDL